MGGVHLLGIDIGTSGTKAVLIDDRGNVVAQALSEYRTSSPRPGWSEQDPELWWAASCRAVRSAVGQAGLEPHDIAGVGLSGQMHGSVFLGQDHLPLRPALLWNDQRTSRQCAEIEARAGGRSALIDLVGNPALTGFTAPKILWVRELEPAVYERTRHILLPKDYVRYRMTGELATDLSDASGTLLLDVANRRWSDEILDRLEIDRALLPSLCESPEVTGVLHAGAAETLGLRTGIPVVGGGGDQAAGAVGNGVVSSGLVSATLGTSGVVFAHSERPLRDRLGRVHTMCHAVPGRWCIFGCMLAAGGSFQWFRDQLGSDAVAEARRNGSDPYALLIAEAELAPPGSEGLFFLPYLSGERCPHPDPHARGAWIGLSTRTTRAMMVRSLLEGITFGMRDILEIIREMGIPTSHVRAGGGGARSSFWLQLQADIYRARVVMTRSVEGPAFGAALLAGVGQGLWGSVEQACAATIRQTSVLEPAPSRADLYDRHHATYRRLYDDLKERFAEIALLSE